MTKVAKGYAGSTPEYLNDKRTSYDSYGRVKDSFDALGRKTTTSYLETNGLTASTTVTNPLNHVTTTTLDPARGLPTKVVDPNGRVTSMTYDALGRLAQVWKPGRSQGTDSAHVRYAYEVRNNGPSWVKTEKLNANYNHVASFTLFDGLLRERQTQAPSPQGGRILTDTLYDSRGLKSVTRAPYYHKDAPPGTTLFLPDAGAVPNATVQVYDGAERQTDSIYTKVNVEQWRTRTYHGGDHTSVVPPAGGTATTTYKDARGKTSVLLQYKTRPASGPPTGAADRTEYGYTKRGDQASVKDPAGNVWRYDYDVLGRKIRADDPDHGVSTMTYDDAGQVLTATDARSRTITTAYDDLGRKKETRFGSTVLTQYVYDTLSRGALTSSTRYVGGHAYTRNITGYDAAGLPKGESVVIPANEAGLAGTYPTETTFRADGSPASTKLPRLTSLFADETLVHEYNDLGLPDKVTAGITTYLAKTTYTALAEPTQIEMGPLDKRVWRTTYREEGTRRVSELLTERNDAANKMTNQLTYAYDPAGNITRIGDRTISTTTADMQCFKYDYLRRVTNAWTATDNCATAPSASIIGGPAPYWQQYGYDPTGNRKTLTRKGLGGAADQVSTYTYPTSGDGADRPHAVSSIQTGTKTDTYGYDAAGNTVSRPGQTLTWNDEGLLESVGSTSYVYDADGEPLIRRDAGSATLFVGGGEVKLDTTTKSETGTRYYEGIGTRTSAGLTWTVTDHHGTAQVAINADDLTTTTRRFDLFGNPRVPAGGAAAASTTGWPGGNRGFVGGITNDATGLTRLGAREYDPATGTFLSTDPIKGNEPRSMHPYGYSANNPATFSDPSGLYCDSCEFYDKTKGEKSVWTNWVHPKSKCGPWGILCKVRKPIPCGSRGYCGKSKPPTTNRKPHHDQPGALRPCPANAKGCSDSTGATPPTWWDRDTGGPKQLAYCMSGPIKAMACFEGRKLAEVAAEEARKRFQVDNPRAKDDLADAFLHAYWAALIAIRYGPDRAIGVTTTFENRAGNPYGGAHMDTANDHRGARYIRDVVMPKAQTRITGPIGFVPAQVTKYYPDQIDSDAKIAEAIYQMATSGQLETLE